jgi:hypothetical protein
MQSEAKESFMLNASIKLALALTVVVGMSASASAQRFNGTPLAGSAGAGDSAINGIAPGPANPGLRSDPSGVRNTIRTAGPRSPSIRVPTVPQFH